MKKNKIILLLTFLTLWSCQNKENIEFIDMRNVSTKDSILSIIDEIVINVDYDSTFKFFGANKIFEYNDTTLMVLDIINVRINFITNKGKFIRSIGGKGSGPGEFISISDFTFDGKGNIYVLDTYDNKVGMFSNEGKFKKNFRLSFVQRMPSKILYYNGYMLVEGITNLINGSTRENFKFLDFKDNSYISVYDTSFNYIKSFLNPNKKLYETNGIFSRPYSCFATYATVENNLIAITQEGFYTFQWFDRNIEPIKSVKVDSRFFKEFELERIKDLKFNNNRTTNFTDKKIGGIIGNHSVPMNILYSNPLLMVQIRDPLENYFPTYTKNSIPEFRSDLFLYNGGKLVPILSYFNNKSILIGSGKDGVFYFSDSYAFRMKKVERFTIKKIKINSIAYKF